MVRRGGTANPPTPSSGASRLETAAYVAALSEDLARLARRSGMPTLAYLLDMARLEAEGFARRGDGRPDGESDPGLRLS